MIALEADDRRGHERGGYTSNMIRRFFRHIREGFYGGPACGNVGVERLSGDDHVADYLDFCDCDRQHAGGHRNIEGSVKISAFVAYDHEEQAQLDDPATIKNLELRGSAWNTCKGSGIDELMETYEMKAPEKRWKPIKDNRARCVLCGSERRGRIKGRRKRSVRSKESKR